MTFDVGTDVDEDVFADGFDAQAAGIGDLSAIPAAFQTLVTTADDTLDIVVKTLTGTITAGKFRLWAVLCDVTAPAAPGAAALGS